MTVKEAVVARFMEILKERNMRPNELANLSGITPSTVYSMFDGCARVSTIILPKGLRPIHAYDMFSDCKALTQVNIKDIDFSQCTNMSSAFYNCYSLTVIPRLNTGNCNNLYGIF